MRDAQAKLDLAKRNADDVNVKALTLFRDQLVIKSLEAIDQAALDEIGKASRDGLTEDESKAIADQASALRATAIKSINEAFSSVSDTKAKQEYDKLYVMLTSYWTARLGIDEQNVILMQQLGGK